MYMLLPAIILGVASLLASGILFRHQRILTLLAGAGVIFEAGWLALTLAHRTLFTEFSETRLFLIGAVLLLLIFLPGHKEWRWPYRAAGSGWRDIIVLGVLIVVLSSAWLIQQSNGFIGDNWVAHGYYNGDTATFAALVQRSLNTPGLVEENPLAGNGHLEYPTLIHAGFAEAIKAFALTFDWLSFLPLVVFIQILITVPLFFLLRDAVKDIPAWPSGYRWGWRGLLLEGGLVGYVLAISWESYVYPQGHFFTTALFIFLVSTLVRSWSLNGRAQIRGVGLAGLVTVLLVLSNAVTGTAAAVVWTIFAALRVLDTTRPVAERVVFGASVAALVIFVLMHTTPGAGHLTLTPWFSYTAAHSFALLAAPITLLLLAILTQLRQQMFIGITTIALGGLALVTFIFSDRELIIDNASRFLYHGLLVGWPLAVDSFVRSARVVQARLRQLDGWPLRGAGLGLMGIIFVLLAVPAAASVAEVHDQLLFKHENTTNATTRFAMRWIYTHTAPDAVFIASPNEPWEIPMFTGRALLRTEYWISPEDDVQRDVIAAFAGDRAAQERAIAHAEYVLLRGEERDVWNIAPGQLILEIDDIAIYDVRSAL